MPEFQEFGKIYRLRREWIITEKIDGTNAQVYISDDFKEVLAGSRNRWITPEDDNYGFAKWVKAHREELLTGLGPGTHYGEWWGQGIQRGYGLKEKRFSLFNVSRWTDDVRPTCCGVVPVLARGVDVVSLVGQSIELLRTKGSVAAPGFMRPEGVVSFHVPSQYLFKTTLEKDEEPKGRSNG